MLAGIHQNFYKLTLSFLMKVARHVQSSQNRKLGNFLQYVKEKSIATAFEFYCDTKHSEALRGVSHVRCYLFLSGFGQKCMCSFRELENLPYLKNELMR